MKTHKSVLIAALVLISACGRIDTEREMAAAKADFASGDLQAATIRLSNVLQAEPSHADARLLRGRVALSLGDYATAVAELDRARALGAVDETTAVPLASAAARLGEHERAIAVLDAALPALENDGEYWIVRAEVTLLAGERDAAASALDRAARLGSVGSRYLVARGQLAQLGGDLEDAESQFLAATAQDPGAAEAHSALGELYAKTRRPAEAAAELATAADLFRANERPSDEVNALVELAELQVSQNDLDSASISADRLSQLVPQSAVASYVRGMVAYRQGRFDGAAASLQNALNAQPDNPALLKLLSAVQLALGNLGQAEQHLLRVLRDTPSDREAIQLLAETRLRQQRPDAALDALRPLANSGAQDARLSLLTGLANLLAGNAERGIADLEQASVLDPENSSIKIELAKAYVATGRYEEASELAGTGFGTGRNLGDLQARLVELLSYAGSGNLEAGNRAVTALLEEQPRDPRALIAAAIYRQATNDPSQARELLERAVELNGDSTQARLLLADTLAREGRVTEAAQHLQSVVSREPDNVQALAALGLVELRTGASERALEIANSLQAEFPQQVQGFLLEARVETAGQRYASAAEAFRLVYERQPVWPVLTEFVSALQLAGRTQDAVNVLDEWLGEKPADIRARLLLATVLQTADRAQEALSHYDAVLRIDENNVIALNNAAWLRQAMGDAQALPLAERAFALAPENPGVLDTFGLILLRQNREQDAIGHLEKAAQLAPEVLEIRYNLAQAQVALGQEVEGRATLVALLAEQRPFEQRAAAQQLLNSL